ncbi:beta-ketoacyl synthase [Micromonospora sp. HNM0581]|uniref:beta-ketoacyl synthase N-terminal-like domain-containing protein n=1 Tax=Micromonospora sp. HNM0581 TaxID=2716341 RepID=UPI00146AF238|nr:beta-ketoacyl synthase N-terminal-like domain-containing protein [Micromonospora sp. HNM0581]NLU78239.1 beta-ketoacyl synthase [Micromonospora sp. HNM0581]
MSGVVITGWSTVSPAGVGRAALTERLTADVVAAAASTEPPPPVDVTGLSDEPLPSTTGHALVDFDVRAHLGRKGTSFYDRATALAVVACGEALSDAGVLVDDSNRARLGVVLGTSLGSFRSTSDYTRDTLVQEKPYLVNPVLFPNTVMNCAAGQAAIRHGLRGVNATVATGPLAFLDALRYGTNAITRGYVDAMLVGAVEEFSPHRAWNTWLTGRQVPTGEAAAVFLLTRAEQPAWAGPRREAEVLALATAYGPGGGESADRALTGCVSRAVRRAGVDPAQVSHVLTGETGVDDTDEFAPACAALGHTPTRTRVGRLFGHCDAATGGLALATFLAAEPVGARTRLALLTSRSPDGGTAAAIIRGWSGAGPADR